MAYGVTSARQRGTNFKPEEAGQMQPSSEPGGETRFIWRVDYADQESGRIATVSSGDQDFRVFFDKVTELMKLQRRRQDHLAGVNLDSSARRLLELLDRQTSLRWDALKDRLDLQWDDICRAVALLASADLCEPGPSRLRLTDTAVKVLSQERNSPVT